MNQQGLNNKELIVEAADQLFYQYGYSQTSFSDISDKAGIPRGNFYYYFKTKDDILTAVLTQRHQLIKQLLQDCENYSNDVKAQLIYLLEVLLRDEENIVKYGCPVGTISSELSKSSVNLQMQVTDIFETLRQWIEIKMLAAGLAERSKSLSMEMLARLQGVTVLANVYHDIDFLRQSIQQHKQWLTDLLNAN
ncbi:MAG: TetR/AcrR family transcriptional regulator [Gammaproteobacteria bacterium]|nr:TetR/AcrR family transcriptional regulator [Gammaproteobacteria bacterium]